MFSDKLLRYGIDVVQGVVVQFAVACGKDITFAHLDRQLEEHFTQVFFKSTEHQLDILTYDRRQIADAFLLNAVTDVVKLRV